MAPFPMTPNLSWRYDTGELRMMSIDQSLSSSEAASAESPARLKGTIEAVRRRMEGVNRQLGKIDAELHECARLNTPPNPRPAAAPEEPSPAVQAILRTIQSDSPSPPPRRGRSQKPAAPRTPLAELSTANHGDEVPPQFRSATVRSSPPGHNPKPPAPRTPLAESPSASRGGEAPPQFYSATARSSSDRDQNAESSAAGRGGGSPPPFYSATVRSLSDELSACRLPHPRLNRRVPNPYASCPPDEGPGARLSEESRQAAGASSGARNADCVQAWSYPVFAQRERTAQTSGGSAFRGFVSDGGQNGFFPAGCPSRAAGNVGGYAPVFGGQAGLAELRTELPTLAAAAAGGGEAASACVRQVRQQLVISRQHHLCDEHWRRHQQLERVVRWQHRQLQDLERKQRATDHELATLRVCSRSVPCIAAKG
ncbi:hypothetical protein DIPPA_04460 [Diplonema papillatum]|nr:hypothetical protein DIPPA_04460 [Diplonema papillatum]